MYVMLCWCEGGVSGMDPKILKRGGALCWSLWLAEEDNFRFQMIYKGQNNVTNYKFFAKYLYHHFQIFSIFKYNESLPMKFYQIFKMCKCFDKEREKSLCNSQSEKKN